MTPATLETTVEKLVQRAGENRRLVNAVKRGAQFITENRCEIVDDETILVHSDSGITYTTSLTDCTDESGENCPAWQNGFPCKHRAALHLLIMAYSESDTEH